MGRESESLSERIIRLHANELDPIAQLLLEVKEEARATRKLLEETKKRSSNGNGNGKFGWDFILKITSVLLTAAMIGMFSWAKAIESRVTRIEENRFTAQDGATVKANQQVIIQRVNELERWRYAVERRNP